ncbi:MAG: citrate synthase [Sneathiellaceae bacterium]
MSATDHLTAREAAALLGVGRATLYAYVSRGLIRSAPFGNGRQRRYPRADVDRLVRRRQGGAEGAGTGQPADGDLLPSAITLIADGRLSYRGHDAAALAEALTLEETARLLWRADDWDPFAAPADGLAGASGPGPFLPPIPAPPARLSPLALLQASLPLAEAMDPQAVNHGPRGCARTGARLLHHALDVMVPEANPAGPAAAPREPIHRALARRWGLPDMAAETGGGDLLRRALVLCADHEFNASTFAARCIAGTGASVYAAVAGALAALGGPRHGGATARVAAMLDLILGLAAPAGADRARRRSSGSETGAEAAIAARLGRGEDLPGFGHTLYPGRDPRAAALLKALAGHAPDHPLRIGLADLARAALKLSDRHPNVDFALVAVCRVLALPPDAPLILFALGRIAGWVAHAEEQYRDGRLVRPRSAYVGPPPL